MDFTSPDAAFFKFISDNLSINPQMLRLRSHNKLFDFDVSFAITQIECRKKSVHKLPGFITNPFALFPSSLACEQSSHQSVAQYHASLLQNGNRVIDMTAGLGIDSMAFAKVGCRVTACDTDLLKTQILQYNTRLFGLDNIEVVNTDSIGYIREYQGRADVIFVDPSRRGDNHRRIYNIHECSPDVTAHIDQILSKCDRLFVKASPLIDLTQTLKDIPHIRVVRTVSVEGECKEVLLEVSDGKSLEAFEAVDLSESGETNYRFVNRSPLNPMAPQYAEMGDLVAGNYLYEPGASVMKLSPWGELSRLFPGLKKLGVSSHLFVSDKFIETFPGRKLAIKSLIGKKDRRAIKGSPANVVTRNYPSSPDLLRRELGVKEGNEIFIYGTRLGNTPVLLEATRL